MGDPKQPITSGCFKAGQDKVFRRTDTVQERMLMGHEPVTLTDGVASD
jgi:hypothetical protein